MAGVPEVDKVIPAHGFSNYYNAVMAAVLFA
jgi:hypothetical protein